MNAWDRFIVWLEAACALWLLSSALSMTPSPECRATPTPPGLYVTSFVLAVLIGSTIGRGLMLALGRASGQSK